MNVTVCQFHDHGGPLEHDWEQLCEHARTNRATDGGGWIIDPDGETVALTQQAQPFVTVDLECAAIQLAAG